MLCTKPIKVLRVTASRKIYFFKRKFHSLFRPQAVCWEAYAQPRPLLKTCSSDVSWWVPGTTYFCPRWLSRDNITWSGLRASSSRASAPGRCTSSSATPRKCWPTGCSVLYSWNCSRCLIPTRLYSSMFSRSLL